MTGCKIFIHFLHAGLRKKLEAAAKEKGCERIREWQRSIMNHFYWCVSSTEDGDPETMLAKWLSLENHIHNEHRHDNNKFPKCAHGKLRGQDRKKKWFERRKHCFICIHDSQFIMQHFYRLESE